MIVCLNGTGIVWIAEEVHVEKYRRHSADLSNQSSATKMPAFS